MTTRNKAMRGGGMFNKRYRSGFSMMEILAALAIVAVLAALLLANLGSFQRKARLAHMVETLETLTQGLREFDRQTGRYPTNLRDLYVKPAATATDICGQVYTQAIVNKWRGPYVGRMIPAIGLVIETDTITNELERDPASSASPGEKAQLQIFVRNPPSDIALDLDTELDGDGMLTDGEIQWNISPGYPRLIYSMPMTGC